MAEGETRQLHAVMQVLGAGLVLPQLEKSQGAGEVAEEFLFEVALLGRREPLALSLRSQLARLLTVEMEIGCTSPGGHAVGSAASEQPEKDGIFQIDLKPFTPFHDTDPADPHALGALQPIIEDRLGFPIHVLIPSSLHPMTANCCVPPLSSHIPGRSCKALAWQPAAKITLV